jgi:membrane protein
VRERLDRLGERWPWFGTVLRVYGRYNELNGNYLAAAVTLSAFLSIFPLVLVGLAVAGFFSSSNSHLANDLISNFGLHGKSADTLRQALATAEHSRRAASIVGLVGLLWSGLGLVSALQYAINTVWQVKGRGLRDKVIGLAWLGGAGLLFVASFAVTAGLNFLPGVLAPVGVLVGLALDFGLWLWTMKVMGNRDVGWKVLVPGAAVGAVGLEVLKAVGSFYVPRLVASASALYGSLGIVFAVLAWLLLFGRLLVYAAVVNVVRWEEDHGTVTTEIELPRLPGLDVAHATRAGEAIPTPDVDLGERVT